MTKQEINFIKEWFNTDLDIPLQVNGKSNNIITLKSDVWYRNNQRVGGDTRSLLCHIEFDDNDYDKIYDLIDINLDFRECLSKILAIENRGLRVSIRR